MVVAQRVRYSVLVAGVLLAGVAVAQADPIKAAADIFPDTTVAYAEVAHPKQLLDIVLDHPLRDRAEQLRGIQRALQKKEYLQLRAIVAALEARVGMPSRKAVEGLTAGGIYFALDGPTQGIAILVKAQDAPTARSFVDAVVELARADARGKGADDPVRTNQYRQVTAYQVGPLEVAMLDQWLVLVSNPALGKRLVDNYLQPGEHTLGGNQEFASARASMRALADATGAVSHAEAAPASSASVQPDTSLVNVPFSIAVETEGRVIDSSSTHTRTTPSVTSTSAVSSVAKMNGMNFAALLDLVAPI